MKINIFQHPLCTEAWESGNKSISLGALDEPFLKNTYLTLIVKSKSTKYFCREVLPTSLKVFLGRSRSIFEGIVEEFSINHNERRALWSLNWAMALALHQVKISCAQVLSQESRGVYSTVITKQTKFIKLFYKYWYKYWYFHKHFS